MTRTAHDALLPRTRDFTLAALAAGYPSAEAVQTLSALGAELSGHAGLGRLVSRLREGTDGLRADYARCFDVGKERVPLYETEYGRMRGLSKGKDLADVVGFYRAFGFDLDTNEAAEMPDHVAVELEFYALLLYKQHCLSGNAEGTEIVADARRKFLTDHLGGFVAALAAWPVVTAEPVYGPILAWVASLVAEECRIEGVTAAPLDFFAQDDASTVAACGGCVTIPGMPAAPGEPPRAP